MALPKGVKRITSRNDKLGLNKDLAYAPQLVFIEAPFKTGGSYHATLYEWGNDEYVIVVFAPRMGSETFYLCPTRRIAFRAFKHYADLITQDAMRG